MRLDHDEVRRIAELARVALDEDALARLVPQIGTILDHVAAIGRLDVTGVPPMAHPAATSPPREDVVAASLPADRAVEAAPASDAGHFVVPRVIDR